MNALEEIAARKQALVERCGQERNEVARVYYQWQARTQTTRQVARFLKNPFVIGAIGLLVLKLPWRRGIKMGGWAWKGWKLLQMVRRLIT